jgi:hypothetical protein
LWSIGTVLTVLVCCTKKNLATVHANEIIKKRNTKIEKTEKCHGGLKSFDKFETFSVSRQNLEKERRFLMAQRFEINSVSALLRKCQCK